MRNLGLIAVFLVFAATSGRAQEVGDAEAGHAFASRLCAICHAIGPEDRESPNASAPTFRRIAEEPGMTATALFVFLQNPHREMPDLILAPEDMRNVIAYILTLKE